jgi:hypothetical protein
MTAGRSARTPFLCLASSSIASQYSGSSECVPNGADIFAQDDPEQAGRDLSPGVHSTAALRDPSLR